MNFVYETDRLILRICGEEIAEDVLVFDLHNTKEFEAVEPIDVDNFYNIEHHRNILNYEYKKMLQLSVVRFWLYRKEDPDTIIGTICFRNIAKPIYSSCQVGYRMDKAHTGKGYCTEALRAGINIMINDLELHRFEALVLPENAPSIAILENLGFKKEGLLRDKIMIQDKWRDHYLYGLLSSEFVK
ncbi:MAG: GNAT family N-acetyltransferase [Lachnospiraceae bacterium]|nr:GNAT family N-acetyltransferase [Lachnospiraceae bacterium]